MKFLEFEVNESLNIVDFNEDFGRLSIPHSRSFHGTPYYELLPRIITGNSDTVEMVVNGGQAVFLEGYKFGCFFDSLTADVQIFPIINPNNDTRGARVSIHFAQDYDFFKSFKKCQHLIDIGKNASILAHGIRNPLNAIKGSVTFLKNKYENESILLEFAYIIEEEISRLDKFITEFLSASNNRVEKQKVNLKELLKNIEALVGIQVRTDNVDIKFQCNNNLIVNINLFQIEQAILNVINNAINAVQPSGKIVVSCRKRMKNNHDFAVIEVLDNGRGFSQIGGKSNPFPPEMFAEGNGKGFGLFISREVMKHHGGMLEIRSEKGTGTSVKLCLPLECPKED